jgi:hypothetical protein
MVGFNVEKAPRGGQDLGKDLGWDLGTERES